MSSATALLADAETSIKSGEWDTALDQLENLKKDQPSQPEVYEKLAHVLAVRGKFGSVITTYLELIRVLVEAESLEHADGFVTKVLELRPENGEARERRIEIENKRGNTARAVYLSRELARLCIDQGDGERSIRLLQDALKHEPGNLDIALELAEMFVSHGHIQDGANQYRKVANAFQEAGNIGKAAEAYRRMKVVQSDDPEVLLTLGRLYTELGKLDEAEQEFRSVLRHDLDHEQALLQLGLVCQLKGRFRSGILAFNKVLQSNPSLVAAKRKLAELHHSQGMMTEAVDFFLQAAQGHLEAEERDDAIECFQHVLSVDENNAPAQQGLTNLGAPVVAKVFEPPTPPTPPEEEAAAPEAPPPPPVPFASSTPEPVGGGAASEMTERLPQMNFDEPGAGDPPKPEPTAPRRPPAGPGAGSSAGTGGPRRGLGGLREGLTPAGGGDKPMLGASGGKPTFAGRPGLVRQGLGQKPMGGMGMSPGMGGDKPMLGRPQLERREPVAPQAAPARPSFADPAPLEDFRDDMAPFEDVFDEPAPAAVPAAVAPLDDDFHLDSPFDEPSSGGGLDFGGSTEGLSFDDLPAAPQGNGSPQIGDFSFDSDEESGGVEVGLRPGYGDEAPDFGNEISDDLFDFGGDPATAQPSASPTLAGGGPLSFDDGEPVDNLFGEDDDLFGDPPTPPAAEMFEAQAAEVGMFDGDADPFDGLFGEAEAADQGASETIGGRHSAAGGGLSFDDDGQAPLGEASFDSLFGDEETEAASAGLPPVEDDLFGGGDLFGEADDAAQSFSPAIGQEPDPGLFSNDSASNDLFNDDDLFSGSDDGALSPGFGNPLALEREVADDLFSESAQASGFDGGSSELDAPLDGGGDFDLGAGLFGDPEGSDGLFGNAAESDDLFSEASSTGDDLFGEAPGADDGLFNNSDRGTENDFGSASLPDEGADDLFGQDFGAEPVAAGHGLFDDGPSSTEDSDFHGFDLPDPNTVAALEQPEAAVGGDLFGDPGSDDLFGDAGGDGLFGGPEGEGLFGDPEPVDHALGHDVVPSSVSGDLFGDFDEAPHAEAEMHDFDLPLDAPTENLFGEPDGGDELFGSPSEPQSYEEPEATALPDLGGEAFEQAGGGLFGDEEAGGDDLFSGRNDHFDEEPPPLDLELPMPDDPPLYSDSSEVLTEPEAPSESERGLFDDESSSMDDLFADDGGYEAPLDIEIPEPGAEPPRAIFDLPDALAAPEPQAVEEAEEDLFDIPVPSDEPEDMFDIPVPSAEVEVAEEEPSFELPEPGEEDALFTSEPEDEELTSIFDSTMPIEEDDDPLDVEIPEPEPISIPEPSIELSGETPGLTVDHDLFEPSLEMPASEEPVSIFEEPIAVELDPADLLSAEEKAEIAQTAQADALDEQLALADAASKIAGYRKALEESPDNLVLRTRLADIHLKFGLLEDAVVQYRQVLRRNPDSIPLLHSVIQAEFWNENYTEAGDSLLALAKLHLKQGEQHEALDTLQSVLSLDPLHFEARKELVSVFTALEESKLAAHHLRQLAETALTKGEVAGAISAFQQLLEISADPALEERLAQIYEGQGDVVRALSSFQSLVGRYRAEERWEEAARVTERIVELDPAQLDDREALVELYQRLGHVVQAVEQQFQLARRYQEQGQTERAIGLFEEVLKVQTDNQDARRFLVDAYLDGGRVSAALEQAEALTEHYLDTKDHTTAISLYSRLVDADPENVELQERLVKFYGLAGDPENAKSRWIHISHLHEQHGRFDRAAESVQRALELDESQLDLQYRLALLYAERLGDNQAALAQLRKLFQLAPDRTEAVKMYIDLLLHEEQVSEAGQVLQRLEQAGGESVEIKSNVIAALKSSVEANPGDLKARFNYGELCYHLGDLDHAIEQFQQTRRHPDYELVSYNMLGLCFASKKGYMMLDLAMKQFQKGLESKARSEQDYLEIRYNLAMVQYQNGRTKEALAELKECYNVDIAYRDVRSWIQKIEGELAAGA